MKGIEKRSKSQNMVIRIFHLAVLNLKKICRIHIFRSKSRNILEKHLIDRSKSLKNLSILIEIHSFCYQEVIEKLFGQRIGQIPIALGVRFEGLVIWCNL